MLIKNESGYYLHKFNAINKGDTCKVCGEDKLVHENERKYELNQLVVVELPRL